MSFSNIVSRYKKTIRTDGSNERNELIYSIKDNFTNSFDQNPSFKVVQLQDRVTGLYSNFAAHIFSWKSGSNIVSDDYKKLVLKDYDQSVVISDMFYFDSAYWLVVDVKAIESVIPSYGIQQCDNTLKWEANGTTYSYPCIIIDKSSQTSDGIVFNRYITLEDNQVLVIVKNDEYSNALALNQRFVFSEEYVYELTRKAGLTGGGLLYLTMVVDELDSDDDLVNNLPDASTPVIPDDFYI